MELSDRECCDALEERTVFDVNDFRRNLAGFFLKRLVCSVSK